MYWRASGRPIAKSSRYSVFCTSGVFSRLTSRLTAFRASACQAKSPLRTLDVLTVERQGDRLIVNAAARSFLHHQVRNMVGSLKLVGEGRWPETALAKILAAKSRAAAGPTAPAQS